MSTNSALQRILAAKEHRREEHKSNGEHHVVRHVEKKHEGKGKEAGHNHEKFKYPLMPIEEVKKKADEGYTFKAADDGDYKSKEATIVTIQLPKLGPIPFVVVPPAGSNKTDDGTEIKAPSQVNFAPKADKVESGSTGAFPLGPNVLGEPVLTRSPKSAARKRRAKRSKEQEADYLKILPAANAKYSSLPILKDAGMEGHWRDAFADNYFNARQNGKSHSDAHIAAHKVVRDLARLNGVVIANVIQASFATPGE